MISRNNDITDCLRIGAGDPRIAYVGRIKRDATGAVHFRLPGVQIHARFAGTAVALEMAPWSGYFMVELDDLAPYKVMSSRCNTVIEVATDLTCGYGNEDTSEGKAFPYPNISNAYYSYAQLTARMLKAQCVQVARSGICLNYDRYTPGVGVFHDMETLYPYTLFSPEHDTKLWDYTQYVPHVVCINLGTNDVEQPTFDKDEFARNMVEFVKMIRGRYTQAKVVLLTGPMLHGEQLASIKAALDQTTAALNAAGETEVYRYDFTPMDGSHGYGTLDHPTVAEHTSMARSLTAFLQPLLS